MSDLPAYGPFDQSHANDDDDDDRRREAAEDEEDRGSLGIVKIGAAYTLPLVTPSELEAHLCLLGAFDVLRETVCHAQGGDAAEPNARWAVFLARAVYRFEQWVAKVLGSESRMDPSRLSDDELPPLDVAMVFHAYHLVSPFYDVFSTHMGSRTPGRIMKTAYE